MGKQTNEPTPALLWEAVAAQREALSTVAELLAVMMRRIDELEDRLSSAPATEEERMHEAFMKALSGGYKN